MSRKTRNYIDEMVDVFGYDYVIGYCLCNEYDLINKASTEADKEKAENLLRRSKKYRAKANQLTKERLNNGL